MLTPNQVSRIIVDCAVRVHTRLGPGLFESVYETALEFELQKSGLQVQRQAPLPVIYEGIKMADGFRVDLLVERSVVVEIKSSELLAPVHYKQVLTYLRCAGLQIGLLLNFGEAHMKDGIKRIVNNFRED